MVCQAASQTRFRALKHESGIAGNATIIVRVIACFQPLQDCQAEYFRHLLKPVTLLLDLMGKDSCPWFHEQHSFRQTLNLNCTRTPPYPILEDSSLPCINPRTDMISENGTLQGIGVAGSPDVKKDQSNEPNGWFYCLPRHRHFLTPSTNSVLREKISSFQYDGFGGTPANAVSSSIQKRFLVFDHSGNQTSLIFNSVIGTSNHHTNNGTSKPLLTSGLREELLVPFISKGSGENRENGEGSEMHEDTEELNALLYSDDDIDEDDDEETSTGHSPSQLTRYKRRSVEEVASSGSPPKRKRLLDENYDASLMDTASSVKLSKSSSSCVRERKGEKIRETISILRKIIPGGKGKDALFVLDEAIQYLTYLKLKAKALGATSF